MTCDDAFDRLTDVHRRYDANLQKHLAGCARCRDMSEALAPAIGLFTAASRTAPPLATIVREESATKLAMTAAHNLARRSRRKARAVSTARQVTACLVATAATAVIAFCALAIHFTDHRQASAPLDSQCLWKTRDLATDQRLTPAMLTAACAACHGMTPAR